MPHGFYSNSIAGPDATRGMVEQFGRPIDRNGNVRLPHFAANPDFGVTHGCRKYRQP
jgi:hypothetical protein